MKKKLIRYVSVLLSFLAGLFLTSYLTQVGNRDMTTSMAEAVLPVLYAETEGTLYNEMHGYRTDMDGGYMKDSVIAVQEDHVYCTTKNLYQSTMELGTIISDIHRMLTGDDEDLTYLYKLD